MTKRGSKRKATVTLMDLAIAANVSVKTASLALKGHPSVSKETAKQVQDVATKLGYVRRRGEKRALGLTVPYITHIAYGELIGAIRELASSYDVVTLIGETTGNPEVERRFVEEFSRYGVEGLILIGPRIQALDLHNISRQGQRVVTVNMPIGEDSPFQFGSVEFDNEAGAYMAVDHLIKQGHRRIVYLAGRLPSASEQQRRRGYFKALQASGLNHDEQMIVEIRTQVTTAWPNFDAGYEQCREMLSKGIEPDALFVYNDVMAIGALKALRESGITVPQDMSVVGFDNLAAGQFSYPPLTTVDTQLDKAAWLTVDTLFRMIREEQAVAQKIHHKLIPDLILRESVKDRTK